MNTRISTALFLSCLFGLSNGIAGDAVTTDSDRGNEVRIGAVAYSPGTVTAFRGITRYLNRNEFASDFVLYSDYDTLVEALNRGEVDIG